MDNLQTSHSISYLHREIKTLLSSDRGNSVLVNLYGTHHNIPYKNAPRRYHKDTVHPWDYDFHSKKQMASASPASVQALNDAINDS
mmetsp:Transcript_137391/g.238982  ORF Transcript_137391/g.238982 Transcript_137391/m.238982 type:complete len:86 (+) Transcript_137391:19-276(+)